MNTLAGAVTLFTEPGATVTAPVFEGPTMFEWLQTSDAPEAFADEIRATRPESNPSRALYGEYLRWVWQVALAQLPDTVEVVEHHARAVSIDEDAILLDDDTVVHADATVLATGWVVPAPSPEQEKFAASRLTYIPADNPVEQDVSRILSLIHI